MAGMMKASACSASTTRISRTTRGASSAATAIHSRRPLTPPAAPRSTEVYGVPESFVIDRDGRIAYKLVGPISADNLDAVLKPQLEKALAEH